MAASAEVMRVSHGPQQAGWTRKLNSPEPAYRRVSHREVKLFARLGPRVVPCAGSGDGTAGRITLRQRRGTDLVTDSCGSARNGRSTYRMGAAQTRAPWNGSRANFGSSWNTHAHVDQLFLRVCPSLDSSAANREYGAFPDNSEPID